MVSQAKDEIRLCYCLYISLFSVEFPFQMPRQIEQRISFNNSFFFSRVCSGVSLFRDSCEKKNQENRKTQLIV